MSRKVKSKDLDNAKRYYWADKDGYGRIRKSEEIWKQIKENIKFKKPLNERSIECLKSNDYDTLVLLKENDSYYLRFLKFLKWRETHEILEINEEFIKNKWVESV